jgi:hypothetical protein
MACAQWKAGRTWVFQKRWLSRESFSDGGDPRAAIRLAAAAVGEDEVDADMMMV